MNIITYIKTIVLDDLKKSSNSNLLDSVYVVYVLYIYIKQYNIYVFKIGQTKNLTNRINQLNSQFADNRIFPIFCGESYNAATLEKNLLEKMNKFKISLTFNFNYKPREFVTISSESYDQINNFYKENFIDFFECTNYEIDDNNIQYYKLPDQFLCYFANSEITWNNDEEHPDDNDIPFVKLNLHSIEKYWKINDKLNGKWLTDDGDCDQDDNHDKDSDESDDDSDFNPDSDNNSDFNSDNDSDDIIII